MEIAKAKKNATIISNDAVFLTQVCEGLIINSLYKKITVITDEESNIQSENLVWQIKEELASLTLEDIGSGDDVFCRILNSASITNYNKFIFKLLKNCSLQGFSRAYINIDLVQYLQKGSMGKLLGYQKLEEQIMKLPFWSTNMLITVKTNSVNTKQIDERDILKSGKRYIGMKLLSSLGLPLIVISSEKIAKVMNLMTYSLDQGSRVYHSDDIQKILNNEKDRN